VTFHTFRKCWIHCINTWYWKWSASCSVSRISYRQLFLLDRMFFIKQYLADIGGSNGHYIVRSKAVINPVILIAIRADGKTIKSK